MIVALLATAFLLVGNGFFVGAEFALIAARRTQLEPVAAAGSRRAVTVLKAMADLPLMIAGAQLGITICSLGLGALAEPAVARLLESPLAAVGVPSSLLHPIAFVIALLIVVYLHTVIGEMVPKNVALAGPERAVLWLGPPMWWFGVATKPLLVAMKWLSRMILRLWGITAHEEAKSVYTADELANLVVQSHTEGLLDSADHQRITGALTLTRRRAAEIMRPWSEVVTVSTAVTLAQLEQLALRTGFSRFPVVDATSRVVRGFVHVKEVLGAAESDQDQPLPPSAIRPLAVVSPDAPLTAVLVRIRRRRSHMVLVTDQRRPAGIVTLDDVLAAVVGSESLSAR